MIAEVTAAIDHIRSIRPGESPFGSPALTALFALAERSDPAGRDAIVRELVPALATPNAYRASCIAITCGTLVELGADPAIAAIAIVERMRAVAANAPYDASAIKMFDPAAMAHLCRRMELRVAARALPGVPSAVDAITAIGATFTSAVLALVDDLELLVIAPAQGKGYVVRLEAVATNAHLFTLLQGELIRADRLTTERGAPLDPAVLAVARGEASHGALLIDSARFNFDPWSGLVDATTLRGDLGIWLPVDGSPRDIPALPDGRRVVLLGPPILGGRSWDSNFFANLHDALRSRVTVLAELAPAAVKAELAQMLRA